MPEFKEVFNGFFVIFRKDIYTEEYLRKIGLNERQMKAIFYIKEKKSITVSLFKTLAPQISEKTLYPDLQEIVKKGILKEIGERKVESMNLNNRHISDIKIFNLISAHETCIFPFLFF